MFQRLFPNEPTRFQWAGILRNEPAAVREGAVLRDKANIANRSLQAPSPFAKRSRAPGERRANFAKRTGHQGPEVAVARPPDLRGPEKTKPSLGRRRLRT